MYNKIKNPVTGRFVNTKGIVGKNVLKNYVYQTQAGGGWFDWIPGMGSNKREEDTQVVNENAELIKDTITDFENKIRDWGNLRKIPANIRNIDIENLRIDIQKLKNKLNKLGGRAGKQDDSEQKVNILQEDSNECNVKLSDITQRHAHELKAIQVECTGIQETLRGQQQRDSDDETAVKNKISTIPREIEDMVTKMKVTDDKLQKLAGIDSLAKSEEHVGQHGQSRDSHGRWERDDMGYGLSSNPSFRENMNQYGGQKKLKNKKKRRN
jgi:hypothetical protein